MPVVEKLRDEGKAMPPYDALLLKMDTIRKTLKEGVISMAPQLVPKGLDLIHPRRVHESHEFVPTATPTCGAKDSGPFRA